MVELGIKGYQEEIVTPELLACHIGSGTVRVFATPLMITLMERTCRLSVQPYLEEGQATVGTRVDIRHLAATPLGGKVTCESELCEIDRRRLVFKVVVFDEKTKVGEGVHERFVIQSDKFLAAARAKGDA